MRRSGLRTNCASPSRWTGALRTRTHRDTGTVRRLPAALAGTFLAVATLTVGAAAPAGAATAKYAAIVADPGGTGYWLVQPGGAVFPHVSAPALTNTDCDPLFTAPVLGAVATPDHLGFWEYDAKGGIACFGDAVNYGHADPIVLAHPIVGMATSYDGGGDDMVDSTGGVSAWGDACFLGHVPTHPKIKPIVAIASYPFGTSSCPTAGFWDVGSAGTVYPFGAALAYGTPTSPSPIVTIVSTPNGLGHWELARSGVVTNLGDAPSLGWTSVARPSAWSPWPSPPTETAAGSSASTASSGRTPAPSRAATAPDAPAGTRRRAPVRRTALGPDAPVTSLR